MNARTLLALFLTPLPLLAACSDANAPAGAAPAPHTKAVLPHVDRRTLRHPRPAAKAAPHRHDTDAPSAGAATPAKYKAFAKAFEAEMDSLGAPGSAVALLEHGEVTFARGFGTKGPNSTAPVDASTLFRIGSMTKSLTATAALGLVDEGQGAVDERVVDLIPGVSLQGPSAKHVTLRHILSHQSEISDFINFSTDPTLLTNSCPTDPGALGQFVRGSQFSQAASIMAPPGTAWAYSNTNFMLAGAAVESMSGRSYADVLAARVLSPLGMSRTFLSPADVLADGDYTDGLSTNDDGTPWDVAPDSYDCGWYRPAGFAFSSVLDYAKFVQFLYRGNRHVLSDASRAAMQSTIVDDFSDGTVAGYGYGLATSNGFGPPDDSSWYDAEVVFHDGAIDGYSAEFYFIPETGFGFIAFANTDGAYPDTSFLQAVQSFAGLTATSKAPPSVLADAPTFPGYAGTFEDGGGVFGQIVISDQGGTFSASFPALDALGITYDTTLTEYAEYGFYTTVHSVPDAALSSELGQLFYPGESYLEFNFIPSGKKHFDALVLEGGLVATRVAP